MRHFCLALVATLFWAHTVTAQATKPSLTFDFHWTSGDLVELTAKSATPETLMVKIAEFPQRDTFDFVYTADKLNLRTRSHFPSDSTLHLVLFREYNSPNGVKTAERVLEQKDSIIFAPYDANVIGNTKLLSWESYYVVAMRNTVLYRMHITFFLGTVKREATVSRLRVLRYPYRNKFLTYAEDEKTKTLSVVDTNLGHIEDIKLLLRGAQDNSAIDSLVVTIDRNAPALPLLVESKGELLEVSDSAGIQSLLPSDRVYEIEPVGTSYWYHETPWVEVISNQDGAKTLFALNEFRLIKSGGNVRVKYCRKSKRDDILSQTVLVFERNTLALEAGSVFSMNVDGKPVGKAEYAIRGESIWYWWLSTMVSMRLTSMRKPVVNNSSDIVPIAEGELQARLGFDGTSEWQPTKFSFVGSLSVRTRPLNDTTDLRAYTGIGFGINVSVPIFNEKQTGRKFGASNGQLTIQVVDDSYWSEARWRLVNDFRINVFSLASNSVTISLRGRADIPIVKSGQADMRLSIMSEADIAAIEKLIH